MKVTCHAVKCCSAVSDNLLRALVELGQANVGLSPSGCAIFELFPCFERCFGAVDSDPNSFQYYYCFLAILQLIPVVDKSNHVHGYLTDIEPNLYGK